MARLRDLTAGGDHAYCTDISHFMTGRPLPEPSTARRLDSSTPCATDGAPSSPSAATLCAPARRDPARRSALSWTAGGLRASMCSLL
ncbi:hypothetical protein [Streptomyces sp. NPDC001978]|uniref:hypothetical protein n=1 Tax=Streptomyces sp. NPDC001978 TaxID=3364627 RepID=UPI0036C49136